MTDETKEELHPWLEVGLKVAYEDVAGNISYTEIKSIGKRDVVLANGTRFNRTHKSLSQSSDGWHFSHLHQTNNPRVVAYMRKKFRKRTQKAIEQMMAKWVETDDPAILKMAEETLSVTRKDYR